MSESSTGYVGPIPQAVLRMFLVRVGMVLICGACLGLVYWSLVYRLQPMNRNHRKIALELSQLSEAVEQMRFKTKGEAAEQTRAKFQVMEHSLFNDPEQLTNWQSQVKTQATPMALNAKVELKPARPFPGAEKTLAIVDATIELKSALPPGDTNSIYLRLLKFTQNLAAADKRCELVSLSMEGNSNSVHHARALVQLLTEVKAPQ